MKIKFSALLLSSILASANYAADGTEHSPTEWSLLLINFCGEFIET